MHSLPHLISQKLCFSRFVTVRFSIPRWLFWQAFKKQVRSLSGLARATVCQEPVLCHAFLVMLWQLAVVGILGMLFLFAYSSSTLRIGAAWRSEQMQLGFWVILLHELAVYCQVGSLESIPDGACNPSRVVVQ